MDEKTWTSSDVQSYGYAELQLRIGHAYDLLSGTRTALRKKGALIQDKDRNARGTKDNLRSQQLISAVQQRAIFLSRAYNFNYDQLRRLASYVEQSRTVEDKGRGPSLGGEPSLVPSNLRVIDVTKDLHVPSLRAPRNLGDSKRTVSWIYQVAGPDSEAQQDWEQESEYPLLIANW